MSRLKRSLAFLVALSVALAPVAAGAASRAGPGPVDGAATSASGIEDCHKPSPAEQKTPDTASHCKHCTDAGTCTPDACAVKCFKVVAEVPTPEPATMTVRMGVRPARLHEPAAWYAAPPAPPPRA